MKGVISEMGHEDAQARLKQPFKTAKSNVSHLNLAHFCTSIRTPLLITEKDNKLVYARPVH